MLGAGKYDALCTDARVAAEAQAVILIILEGNLGSGFCVQTNAADIPPEKLALLLRNVADSIAKNTIDLQPGESNHHA